ncbi:hypothetical protein, partial [Thiolapillus sp.]|uniref:hypothetical protein n=1 Tax=Thiolapillus sp. TaxID=2017437 RepID=UPI003AF50B2A
ESLERGEKAAADGSGYVAELNENGRFNALENDFLSWRNSRIQENLMESIGNAVNKAKRERSSESRR